MRFMLLLIAAVMAVLAGIAALHLSSKPAAPVVVAAAPEPPQTVSTVDIVVAKNAIPPGTMITQAMIDTQPWPANLVLKDFIVSNQAGADVIGKVTRAGFQAREPLVSTKIANLNEAGFLAGTLPEGMRAITISTDAISGVAGFVFPGDRVDILLTHNIPGQIKGSSPGDGHVSADKPAYTETLISNVPVLAINLREVTNKDGGGNPPLVAPSNMTLQVSAQDAENIRLAEKSGSLSLALRSILDANNQLAAPPADLASLTQVHYSEARQAEDDTVKVTRR